MANIEPILIVPAPGPTDPFLSAADNEVPVQQIGQWAMVWRRFRRHRLAVIGAWVGLLIALMALIGPHIAPPLAQPSISGNLPVSVQRMANAAPQWNWRYLLGADAVGQPILTYVLTGGGPLLIIGIFGALLASLLGTVFGGISGYLGGAVDALLMRIVDAFLAVPFLLFLILVSRYLTNRTVPIYVVLFGLLGWAGLARLVRSYVLSLRQREFAEAARALGVTPWGVVLRHLLPNALDVVVVSFTLNIAIFMVTDATLDFLNAGAGVFTWGDALSSLATPYWWQGAFPGLALLLTVLSVNFMGDGLRDALDTSSQTAGFTAGPARQRTGFLSRTGRAAGRSIADTRRVIVAFVAGLELRRRRQAGIERVVPGQVRTWSRAERETAAPAPLAVRFGPLALAFAAVGVVFLLGHSPLEYPPNFDQPQSFGPASGEQEFGARPLPAGGWDVFQIDDRSRLAFERLSSQGRVTLDREIGSAGEASQPSMAEDHGRILGAWVSANNETIEAAWLGAHPSRSFALDTAGGYVEHPYVVGMRGSRFDVLYDGQGAGGSAFDIYLATLPAGPGSHGTRTHLMRIVRSSYYALYPRGIADGKGALDVVYLQQVDHDHGVWQVRFARFTPEGTPLGAPQSLGSFSYLKPQGSGFSPDIEPSQWAIDLKRAKGGSVWVTWEIGDDVAASGGISGINRLFVARWDRDGKQLLPPSVVDPNVDANGQFVAMALRGGGGQLYYATPGLIESYLTEEGFSASGRPTGSERVSYQGGGSPVYPRARTVHGQPRIIWEKIRAGNATLEGTVYHRSQPPDLLTRLGLNIGNVWGNVLLVIFGSLAGGLALTVVNILLLAPLVPAWLLIRRVVPGSARWILFLAAITAWLAWVFAAHPSPPSFVFVIGALGIPYAWVAVAGSAFTSYWTGRFVMARQESSFRAAMMGLVALYFVAAMYAVIFIEAELGHI
ncbi:MAG: ABC transporter permease [Chloroflexota bacterium]|nr:ABC transporter permease [Chloroflexota bacterium]